MGAEDIDWDAVDIDSYVKEAQPYIRKAIQDPAGVPNRYLGEVATTVLSRAWQDDNYQETAAAICTTIILLEQEQQRAFTIPMPTFYRSLMESCQEVILEWDDMRESNPDYCISFSQFLFALVRGVPEGHSATLSKCVYGVLGLLAKPPCVQHVREVELLCSTFRQEGRRLQRESPVAMETLTAAIRDAFLDPDTPPRIRNMLLSLIELRAGDWEMPTEVKSFYSIL